MIIPKVEKPKKLPNNFLKSYLFIFVFICLNSVLCAQKSKHILTPYKLGVLYNYGNEKNFLFDDPDYYYTTNTIKGQLFYKIANWKKIDFELVVQPQIQFLKHQLLNKHFVQPDEANFEAKRAEFVQLKTMCLYGLEFGLALKKNISQKLNLQTTISLGFNMIDTETERLSKGFTFLENFSLGLEYKTSATTYLYLGTNFGHVSNLDFQSSNSGYNVLGVEIGFSYLLR